MAEVAHLFIALVHRFPMKEVGETLAVKDKGFEGCIHGRPGTKRQVLLMEVETLEEFHLAPGEVRENVTTRGLRLAQLTNGQHLRVGEAVLEVTSRCEPCSRMEELRKGLEDALRGRRGVLCRVVRGGVIRRGDSIIATGPDGAGGEREARRGHEDA